MVAGLALLVEKACVDEGADVVERRDDAVMGLRRQRDRGRRGGIVAGYSMQTLWLQLSISTEPVTSPECLCSRLDW
jgi:hypothetical protein